MIQESLKERQAATFTASTELAVAKERAHSHEERLRWKEKQLLTWKPSGNPWRRGLEAKIQERAGSAQRVDDQKKWKKKRPGRFWTSHDGRREANEALEAVHGERRGLAESLGLAQTALSTFANKRKKCKINCTRKSCSTVTRSSVGNRWKPT
jgi:hypothetical protein